MGVLEFFGTLIKNEITSSSIQIDFTKKLNIDHLFLDFNSIVHVSSQKILTDLDVFLRLVLKTLYQKRQMSIRLNELFEQYGIQSIQKKITPETDPNNVIKMFQEHFTEKLLDKLIITLVINTTLRLVRTYCNNKYIKTLMIAIDGVPSKGKMIEQQQRRYLGAVTEEYKKKTLRKYRDYLSDQSDFIYLAEKYSFKWLWSRNKITPGTAFMQKLVSYLESAMIQSKMKVNRPDMQIIVSSQYEIGEAEIKLVRYINKYLADTNDTIMVYSPDADMILLCMLLPVKKLYMLRHNQQTSADRNMNIYDLIDIRMLKNNIGYYINNNPKFSKESFDIDRINYDIVCISTLFGNDFVPKIETLNVRQGFQNVMDAYLKTLLKLKEHNYYLVKKSEDNKFSLNFTFLKQILGYLLINENDFIKHNNLYNTYIDAAKIKYVFDYMEINSENIVSTVNEFKREYEALKNIIKYNGNYTYFMTNDQFMESLKKSLNIVSDGQCVNTTYLNNRDMINLLKSIFRKTRDFPRIMFSLNTYSKSIRDKRFKDKVKDMNEYEKELFKFNNMLDEYQVKFNAYPLSLTENKIGDYYKTYFGVDLFESDQNQNQPMNRNNRNNLYRTRQVGSSKQLTKGALNVQKIYIEGMLWVFNYYFNDPTYINHWYYEYERAPLIRHLLMFLEQISMDQFRDIFNNLDKYKVKNLKDYFNPIEQLIYVSPMTDEVLKLLPVNYRKYIRPITRDGSNTFLANFFVNIGQVTERLWVERISRDVDCRGVLFFNKCLVKSIHKPTASDDKLFLKDIRKVKPTETSIRRSRNSDPAY